VRLPFAFLFALGKPPQGAFRTILPVKQAAQSTGCHTEAVNNPRATSHLQAGKTRPMLQYPSPETLSLPGSITRHAPSD